MAAKLAEERRQDFEAWLARRQDRRSGFPKLPPDYETRLLTHRIPTPTVRNVLG